MSPPLSSEQSDGFMLKYCRMCALELRQGVFIFGEEGKRLQIPEKIRKTVSILVLEEDSLPKKICTDCCSSLEDYSHYKDTVLDAQEKLTSIARNFERSQEQSLLQLQQGTFFRKSVPSKPLPLLPPPESPQFDEPVEDSPNSPTFENHDESESFLELPFSCIKAKDQNDSSEILLGTTIDKSSTIKNQSCSSNDASPTQKRSDTSLPSASASNISVKTPDKDELLSMDEEWNLRCGLCGDSLENRCHLLTHHQTKHDLEKNKPVYGCPMCPRITENYNAIRIHIYRHRKDGTYKCTECDKMFPVKDQLDRHMLTAHNSGGKFACKICGKRFTANCSLVVHMTSKHPLVSSGGESSETTPQKSPSKERSSQEMCDKNMLYSPVESEVQHVEVEVAAFSPDGSGENDNVNTADSSESPAASHRENPEFLESSSPIISNSVHTVFKLKQKGDEGSKESKSDEGTWQCECCDKIFQTLNGYKGHVATHKGKRFECEHCKASFTQKGSLAHHITSTHNQSPKEFRCDFCNKEFITSKLLRRHRRLHTEPRSDSKCTICQKVYKSEIHLKSHMKIHKMTKNFICSTCGKSFPNQHKLNHHENTHTGHRPYQCPHCNYAARSTGPFYRHVKAHLKDKSDKNKSNLNNNNNEQNNEIQSTDPGPSATGIQTPVLEDLSTKGLQKQQIQASTVASTSCATTISMVSGQNTSSQIQAFNSPHSENHQQLPQSISISTQQSQNGIHGSVPHSSTQSLSQQQIWTPGINGSIHIGKSYQNSSLAPSITSAGMNGGIDVVDCAIQHALTCEDLSPHPHSHQTSHGHNYSSNQNQHPSNHASQVHVSNNNNNNNNNNLSHATFVSSTATTGSTLSIVNTSSSHNQPHQSEPMELSYKLQIDNSGFQDMPMELTKDFQRDPLELCVRQDFNPLMDLSSRVSGNTSDPNGVNINSMHMSMVNNNGINGMGMGCYHKLDLAERELSFNDLSGAFRQPIDLIARTEDSSHELCSEGNLVDLSLRSSFVQDQSASSFLRELIDLSARSESFHGELNLTNKHNQSSHSLQQHLHSQHHGHSMVKQIGNNPSHNHHNGNTVGTLQNVIYQDAMFSLQN